MFVLVFGNEEDSLFTCSFLNDADVVANDVIVDAIDDNAFDSDLNPFLRFTDDDDDCDCCDCGDVNWTTCVNNGDDGGGSTIDCGDFSSNDDVLIDDLSNNVEAFLGFLKTLLQSPSSSRSFRLLPLILLTTLTR